MRGIIAVVALLTGCDGLARHIPEPLYEPVPAGVVASVTELEGGGLLVSLDGGETVDVRSDAVFLYGGMPAPGRLLLVGRGEQSTAYVSLGQLNERCWSLVEPAVDRGDVIAFESRFSLPKAGTFDPGPASSGVFPSVGEGFCVNDAGAVERFGHDPSDLGE